MTNEFIRNRSIALDCIRCGAILLVLLFHVASRYAPAEIDPVARFFQHYGFLGVDVFFPLSGYLISRYLLQHSEAGTIRTFFLRRFFRIVPLYMAAVTAYLIAALVFATEAGIIDRIWINYLFLTGWFIFFDGTDTVPYTITWSLSVEEFSYILLGLAAWMLRRHFTAVLVICAVVAVGVRFAVILSGGESAPLYYFPPARLDSIALGGLAAVGVLRERRAGLTAAVFALAGLVSVGLCLLDFQLFAGLIYVVITCATCTLIALFETVLPPLGGPVAKVAARIGFYSYFIYLFHFFNIDGLILLHGLFLPQYVLPFWGLAATALALTFFEAVVSFRVFEGPFLRYGRSLEGRRQQMIVPAEAGNAQGTLRRS